MYKIRYLVKLSIIFSSLAFFSSCEPVVVPTTQSSQAPISGAKNLDKAYIESFDPPIRIGQKYTYLVSSNSSTTVEESSTEILDIKDQDIKVRFISTKTGIIEKIGKLSDFSTGLPNTGVINEGNEDITVPADTYKDCLKISFFTSITSTMTDNRTKTTIWLIKGIGAIKRVDIMPDFQTITTELKEFKI
ncbi:MAG: hypothetical protein H7263_11825 [Candidatus Sericytochromatia bacterium]|nr:hypothetical protein [Candidatus Sericytochromatia bacterium]